MTTVILFRNPDNQREDHEVGDVLAFLRAQFGARFPAGGRITDMTTGQDVTPKAEADIARLRGLAGPLVVEVPPMGPEFLPALAMILVSSAASMILGSIFAKTPPTATARNIQQESPNNGLSERTNRARVNGRIPDIYGQVRATPDLLAEPYKIFVDHSEKEVAYMCVGRGAYEIHDVRDDTTRIDEIASASVEVYGPNTSPNSGDAPQLRIGSPIGLPVILAKRSNSVNGQVLMPQDAGRVTMRGMVFRWPNEIRSQDPDIDFSAYFVPGDVVSIRNAAQYAGTFSYRVPDDGLAKFRPENERRPTYGDIELVGDLRGSFEAGQVVTLSDATLEWYVSGDDISDYLTTSSVAGIYSILSVSFDALQNRTTIRLDVEHNSTAWKGILSSVSGYATGSPLMTRPSDELLFDLSGSYTVSTVTSNVLSLADPVASNPDWEVVRDDFGGQSAVLFPVITTTGERWVGWMTVESTRPITRLLANMVSLNGMYRDNGRQQYSTSVSFSVEIQPVDREGEPVGDLQVVGGQVVGSATTRSTRATTLDVAVDTPSRWLKIRAKRVTPSDTSFSGQVIDEVKWRDLYACTEVEERHFGDVTTVQAVTFATDGALAVKERKLNMLVTRKLPVRLPDGSFSVDLRPTTNVADILAAVCLDPKIGNRPPTQVDFDNFYQTAQEIRDYFGVDVARFDYTIDKEGLSFEEIVSMIADAVFCNAYRRGSVIRLFFEREEEDSALLFNHRNKLPGSEQRTDSFAPEYDGIEYQWIDPETDALTTLYLPEDRSAVSAQVIESVGVRTLEQAHFHAWRAYNKLLYQNEGTSFDALPEANLLILSQRFLNADNSRGNAWDGDVIEVTDADPRVIRLSQPFDWGAGPYTIFLQGSDGMVESMPVSDGGGRYWARLAREPRMAIIVRGEAYNTTTYIITDAENSRRAKPFILTEKDAPNKDGTIPVTAINYDRRYYANDGDFRV